MTLMIVCLCSCGGAATKKPSATASQAVRPQKPLLTRAIVITTNERENFFRLEPDFLGDATVTIQRGADGVDTVQQAAALKGGTHFEILDDKGVPVHIGPVRTMDPSASRYDEASITSHNSAGQGVTDALWAVAKGGLNPERQEGSASYRIYRVSPELWPHLPPVLRPNPVTNGPLFVSQ